MNESSLKVGVVAQELRVGSLIEEVLNILGIEHTSSGLDNSNCLVDTRLRSKQGGMLDSKSDRVVYFDDFVPIEESILGMQGRPVLSSEFYEEPTTSVKIRSFFESIRNTFHSEGLPLVSKSFWPRNAPACLVLTHDVDWLSYSPLHRAVMQGKPVSRYLKSTFRYLLGKRYGDNIQEILRLEANRGVKSTFLFRTAYASNGPGLQRRVSLCGEAGCEVALHAAKKSHKITEAMLLEKSLIENMAGFSVYGIREHGLKFNYPKTWDNIEKAGFWYDMTFGHNEKVGFASGLCYPYHPLNATGGPYPFLEIPTSFMDWSAINKGLNYKQLKTVATRLVDTVLRLNGVLCVNFHNTYLDDELFPDIITTYDLIVSECEAAGYWIATGRECAEWWQKRQITRLEAIMEGGTVRLEQDDPMVQPIVSWPDGRLEYPEPPRNQVV